MKLSLIDHMTDAEISEYRKAQEQDRAWGLQSVIKTTARAIDNPQPTAAQRQERSNAVDKIHTLTSRMPPDHFLLLIGALVASRPDIDAKALEALGNQFCRIAWELDRNED